MKITNAGKLSIITCIISMIMLIVLAATRDYIIAGAATAIILGSLMVLALIISLIAGIKYVWKDKGRSIAVFISMGISFILLLIVSVNMIIDSLT
ncbi:MAG: hypothetical protein WCY62_08145 [Clostridia bacterium]